MKLIYLSVVIPCYEEMSNLQKGVLNTVKGYLEKKKLAYEVIIVDDGSQDGSVQFIEKFLKENTSFSLLKNPHTGKAGAVTTGILKAKGKYILFTDMDQATPIEELDKLLMTLEKNKADIAIGSRKSEKNGSPLTRIIMHKGMIILRKIIVGVNDISDTQCGFKMFKAEAAHKLFSRIYEIHMGFKSISGSSVTAGFDVELLYIAEKMGYTIKEVPVHWSYVETRRVTPIKDSLEGLKDLLRIRRNEIQGKYTTT